MSEEQFQGSIQEAQQELTELNRQCADVYGVGTYDRWQYEADEGTIVFYSGSQARLRAAVQVVGTTSTRSRTWLWAWANESIPIQQSSAAVAVRGFGEDENLSHLRSPELPDDEYTGWEMTAITVKLTNAVGGYRTPRQDGGYTYYAFVQLERLFEAGPSAEPQSGERQSGL